MLKIIYSVDTQFIGWLSYQLLRFKNTPLNWIAVQPIQPHTPLFIIINSGKLLLSLKAVLPNLIRPTSTTDTPIDESN